MRGKNPADTMPFDRKITKTERKNRKKKKQATTRTLSESSFSNYLSTDTLVENNMVDRGGEGK